MGDQRPRQLLCAAFSKVKPYFAMVFLQFGYAGMYIITMLCLKRGMSPYVLVVYRHVAATLAIAPFALVFERQRRPKMTVSTFLKIMVLGLLQPVIVQILYYLGMKNTTATFTSAMFNVLPATTFIMAIIFRLERVKIKKIQGQAKVIGTLATLAGAMVMTFYKGPILHPVWSRRRRQHDTSDGSDQHWVIGTLMILGSCCVWSGFYILQSFTLKKYPAELSLTTLICLTGTVQGAAVALVMEREFSAWAVGWDSRLLAAVYSGVVCSGVAYYLQGMVNKERGPVFVAAFNPLCMIIVAAWGWFILAEQIHLEIVIGAIIIVAGLYSLVWGKSKDHVTSPSLTNGKVETNGIDVKSKSDEHVVMSEISTEIPIAQK